MLLNAHVLDLHPACSTDTTRPQIQGIHIRADGSAVATTGRVLVQYFPITAVPGAEYPTLPGCDPVTETEPLVPFSLPVASAKTLRRALPTSRRAPILHDYLALDVPQTNGGDAAVMGLTDLATPQVFRIPKGAGAFPSFEPHLVQTAPPRLTISFQTDTLRTLLATLDRLGVTTTTWAFREPIAPVEVFGATDDCLGHIAALVMPCTTPHAPHEPDPTLPTSDADHADATDPALAAA